MKIEKNLERTENLLNFLSSLHSDSQDNENNDKLDSDAQDNKDIDVQNELDSDSDSQDSAVSDSSDAFYSQFHQVGVGCSHNMEANLAKFSASLLPHLVWTGPKCWSVKHVTDSFHF